MKLLFDENLSPRLASLLSDLFPDSSHVHSLGFGETADADIYEFAREYDFVVVTKDADFCDLCVYRGFPPKIIWLRTGNCTTELIERLFRDNFSRAQEFFSDPYLGVLALF